MNNSLFHYCPKCASAQFRPSGERAMRCQSCQFEYFFNVAAAVAAVIFNTEGKILFATRAFQPQKGLFDLPGGFLEFGETPEDALKRELKEELNAEVEITQFIGAFPNEYSFCGHTVHTLDLTYVAQLLSTDIRPMDDVADFQFLGLEEIDDEKLAFSSTRNIIHTLKKQDP